MAFVINVRVPNEGKFLEAELKVTPEKISVGQPAFFAVKLLNFGTEDLANLQTEVSVSSPDGSTLMKKQTNKVALLKPGDRDELKTYWDTKGAGSGAYQVQGSIEYGGKNPAVPKVSFQLGDIVIRIMNVSTDLTDAIAKINVDVQSEWNEKIEKVYAEIVVKNQSIRYPAIRTSSIDLEPWGAQRLTAFWEREGISPGEYTMDILVYYYDKNANKQVQVSLPHIAQELQAEGTLMKIALGVLGIILLINLVWFYISMKKKKK